MKKIIYLMLGICLFTSCTKSVEQKIVEADIKEEYSDFKTVYFVCDTMEYDVSQLNFLMEVWETCAAFEEEFNVFEEKTECPDLDENDASYLNAKEVLANLKVNVKAQQDNFTPEGKITVKHIGIIFDTKDAKDLCREYLFDMKNKIIHKTDGAIISKTIKAIEWLDILNYYF